MEECINNANWSKSDRDQFYYCLHQKKDNEKAHYLNEKAIHLIASKRKNALKGAIELMNDAITGYPNKTLISRSYLLRARAYELVKNLKAADTDYNDAYVWAGIVAKDRVEAASQYAEFIMRHHRKPEYDKALELAELLESDIYKMIVHEFVMWATKAIIAHRRGKRLYRSANEALKLVQIRKYKNTSDKTGLVDLDRHAFMIDELLKIVNK